MDEFFATVVPIANWDDIGPGKGEPPQASAAASSSATTYQGFKGSPPRRAQKGKKGKGKVDEDEEGEALREDEEELPTVWTPEDQRRGCGPAYMTPWGTR